MVGRYVRFTAATGAGEEIASPRLEIARSLRDASGCRLYAITRDVNDLNSVPPSCGTTRRHSPGCRPTRAGHAYPRS